MSMIARDLFVDMRLRFLADQVALEKKRNDSAAIIAKHKATTCDLAHDASRPDAVLKAEHAAAIRRRMADENDYTFLSEASRGRFAEDLAEMANVPQNTS